MYTPQDLRNLSVKPKINDISLKLLSDYYTLYLSPYVYSYNIVSDKISGNINLVFDPDKFCHLLGVESIVRYSVPTRELYNYKGRTGWNNVTNSTIDIKQLKSINKKKFNNVKAKYVYFYLIPDLIENPSAVNFNVGNIAANTNIACEILFYSAVENDNAIIHLGIEKDPSGLYFPRTFFVEKVSDINDDIYINNQTKLEITFIEKKNRQP